MPRGYPNGPMPDRFCPCGTKLAKRARRTSTGYCKPCADTRPERRAQISAAQHANHADPHYVEKRRVSLKAAAAKRMADPVKRAKAQEVMRATGLRWGGSKHRDQAPICRKGRNTKLADIPLAFRDEYVQLGKSKRLLASERREIILAEAAAAVKRHHKGHADE